MRTRGMQETLWITGKGESWLISHQPRKCDTLTWGQYLPSPHLFNIQQKNSHCDICDVQTRR